MTATLKWQWSTAATASWSDVGSDKLIYKRANDNLQTAANPLWVGASTTYSYEKALRVYMSVAPETSVSDLQIKLSGTSLTYYTQRYGFPASYTEPAGPGLSSIATSGPLTTTPVNITNGTGPFTSVGQVGNLIYLQMRVLVGATPEPSGYDAVNPTLVYKEV